MDWNYKRDNIWGQKYATCNGKKQSPINIDTNTFDGFKNRCDIGCQLGLKYEPSKCHIANINDTPTVYFDKGSYIKFNGHLGDSDKAYHFGDDGIFQLKKATFHSPSMHTINNSHYDMEVMLYHYSLGDLLEDKLQKKMNNNSNNDSNINEKGVIISLFYKKGYDKGMPNEFFSQFINRFPSQPSEREIDIPVNEDWSPKMLIPDNKSYFTYAGSLPTPPCNQNWYYIVFEEPGIISKQFIEGFNLVFKRNKRTTQKINGRSISYNNNAKFNKENEQLIIEINDKISKLSSNKKKLINELPYDVPDSISKVKKSKDKCETKNNNNNNNNNNLDTLKKDSYLNTKKESTKYIILFMVFILTLLLSYFIAKYYITSDILPNFIVNLTSSTSTSIPNINKTSGNNMNNNLNSNIANNLNSNIANNLNNNK
jgi:carbonic anhydrase